MLTHFLLFLCHIFFYFCENRRSDELQSTAAASGIHVSDVWYLLEAILEGSVTCLYLWRAGIHKQRDNNLNEVTI